LNQIFVGVQIVINVRIQSVLDIGVISQLMREFLLVQNSWEQSIVN
jgi:hypothetical protein